MGYFTYRWLHEAPEDENPQPEAPAAEAPDAGADNAQDNPDDAGGEEDDIDDDFNIDTSLDGDDDEDNGGEDDMMNDDSGNDTDTDSSMSSDTGDQSPNQANTDIFTSLTAEEQQIKIGELKKLYKDMYSSVNDLIHRVDDMELDEDIMDVMTQVSSILHRLQDSIADYFKDQFDMRSYFENDVKYNEFLLVLKKTTTIVDDLANSREKRIDKDSPNSEDKNSNI